MKLDKLVDENTTLAVEISPTLPEVEVTDVPSQFLPYPEGSKISYKPYTYGELLQFNQSKLSQSEQFKRILSGIKTSFPIEDLSYFDFVYIGLLRKISTFGGDKFSLSYHCSSCGKPNTVHHSVADIEFKDLEITALPIILTTDDGTELEISTLSVSSYLSLLETDMIKDKASVYASSILNHEFAKARDIITNLTGEIIQDLDDIDVMLNLGVKPLDLNCTHCKADNQVTVDEPGVLVTPFRGPDQPKRTRIRFGR